MGEPRYHQPRLDLWSPAARWRNVPDSCTPAVSTPASRSQLISAFARSSRDTINPALPDSGAFTLATRNRCENAATAGGGGVHLTYDF